MQPEIWKLLSKTDEETIVSRKVNGRITVWTLRNLRVFQIKFSKLNEGCNHKLERIKTYNGQCDSKLCWSVSAHKRGIPLSHSRIDTILREYGEGIRV